jgi:hypothetical protein
LGLKLFRAHLREYRRLYAEEGDPRALLLAVDLCLRTGGKVPADLATAFCDRLDEWFRDQVRTLDESFGVERPRGQHFDDLKKRSRDRMRVLRCALRLRETENLPVGGELFAAVAEKLGLPEDYVRERWYDKKIRDLRLYLLRQERKKPRRKRLQLG